MTQRRLHFYDSAAPANIPSGVLACAYVNGFAWPDSEIERMGGIRRITVQGGREWAKTASIIDVENGAASPADVVPFIEARAAEGYDDATAYVNRSNYGLVRRLVSLSFAPCAFWVATLDGTTFVPGAWAVQYHGGVNAPFDVSVLYGHDWFHRP